MMRFLLGLLSGALLADLLQRIGFWRGRPFLPGGPPPPDALDLAIRRDGERNRWVAEDVTEVYEKGERRPRRPDEKNRIQSGGTVTWTLDGPDFAMLQLDPRWFRGAEGSEIQDDGVVILSRERPSLQLKARNPQAAPLKYTYSIVCLNAGGDVGQIEEALREGRVGKVLANEALTLAVGASPPRMIII